MKILGGIPSILMPNIRMDSVLNMHVAIPLINADDFIMYGKSIIMEEAGILNDNICANMLFGLEAVYAEEMKRCGFDDYWLPGIREQLREISALIGGQIWDPANIFSPLRDRNCPVHVTDIIWRRDCAEHEEGVITYAGVYPDNNTIPMHNFLTGETADIGNGYIGDLMEHLGGVSYGEDDRWKADGKRPYRVFYYYEPLPSLGIKGDPDDPSYYSEFISRSNVGVYRWIKRLMSGLMIYSADTVAVARDMSCISDLEEKPDESAFPAGDVFMSGDRAPVKKLCSKLGSLPEGALVPNKKIWTAAQFEKYLPKEVKKALDAVPQLSGTEAAPTFRDSLGRITLRSMSKGGLTGLEDEYDALWSETHPAGRVLDKIIEEAPENVKEERREAVKRYRERAAYDITRNGMWNLSDKRLDNTKNFDPAAMIKKENTPDPEKNKIKQLFPKSGNIGEKEAGKESDVMEDIKKYKESEWVFDNAFVDEKKEAPKTVKNKSDPAEILLDRAFLDQDAPQKTDTETKAVLKEREAGRSAESMSDFKIEAQRTLDISKRLEAAFLEDGIE